MAHTTRDERQLMRQRGAGSRDVNSIDFALGFGSHGSRDERQLMRRRGAGNRKIDNIDFGFAFPTSAQKRRSTSRTPQSARRGVSRVSKTPTIRGSQEPSTTRSSRGTHSVPATRQPSITRQLSQTPPPPPNNENVVPKKRRLEAGNGSTSRRSSTRRKMSEPTFAIAEETGDHNNEPTTIANHTNPNSPLFLVDDGDKENQTVEANDSQHVLPRKSKAPQQELFRRRTRSSLSTMENSIAPSIEAEEQPPAQETPPQTTQSGNDSLITYEEVPQAQATTRSLAIPNQAKKRRKRKSVVLGRKKRRSSGNESNQSTSLVQTEVEGGPDRVEETELEEGSSLEILEEEPTVSEHDGAEDSGENQELSRWRSKTEKRHRERTKRRNRLSVSTSPQRQDSGDEEGDGTYIDEENTPDPTTPAPKRKASGKRKSSDGSEAVNNKKRKTNSGSTFPILTHRMTNIHALPTIYEEGDTDHASDHDLQVIPDSFKDRAVPNAVDVLAQICRETVENAVEQLKPEPGTNSGRGEISAKRTALQVFGKELDQRLFDMSEAVEYRLTLEARLRKSKREKADLQAQWIDIRRQRDEIGLRADAIRRQNWENEETSKRQWEVSQLAQQTELSLETEAPEEGLEFLLRTVAGSVSSAGNNCGMLDRVKSFNAQLERVALLLESR